MKLTANLIDRSRMKHVVRAIRGVLEVTGKDLEEDIADHCEYIFHNYELDKVHLKDLRKKIHRNILDTLTVIIVETSLFIYREEEMSGLLRSIQHKRFGGTCFINLKHLEMLIGEEVSYALEYLHEHEVLYKILQRYVSELSKIEIDNVNIIAESILPLLRNLSLVKTLPLERSHGCVISADKQFYILTRGKEYEYIAGPSIDGPRFQKGSELRSIYTDLIPVKRD